MTTARILSIDGGGIRGLIPAIVLEAIEKELGTPIAGRFHLVAGTSTGGIIAAALCCPHAPMPAKELVGFYENDGPRIFSCSPWHTVASLGGTVDEKYSAAPLEVALKVLGGRLSDVTVADLLVPAYEIERRDPFFFKSWKAHGRQLDPGEKPASFDFALADVARATSAAPTYFEPAKIRSASGDSHALVDGGVFANNPAMCAYAAARKLYPSADDFLVVSIGTGQLERAIPYDDARNWGLLGWARPILSVIFDGVSDTVDYQLDQLAPVVTHVRLQTSLGRDPNDAGAANDDMDDASRANLERLEASASRLLRDNSSALQQVVGILKTPRDAIP